MFWLAVIIDNVELKIANIVYQAILNFFVSQEAFQCNGHMRGSRKFCQGGPLTLDSDNVLFYFIFYLFIFFFGGGGRGSKYH